MALRILHSDQFTGNPSKTIRVLEPLERLARAGLVQPVPISRLVTPGPDGTVTVDLAAVASCDAVWLHFLDLNRHSAPVLAPLLDRARDRRVAVVCDADDPYFFPADAGLFDAGIAPHLPVMRALLARADVVTVTVPALADELRRELPELAAPFVVVPNFVELEEAPQRPNRGGHPVRVGWSGGSTHLEDLAEFLPAVRRLQQRVPVDLVLFGLFDAPIADTVKRARAVPAAQRARDAALASFGRMADALEGVRYEHHPSVEYARFAARLAELDLDVGVCPVRDTRFNRCRSAVKAHQYAAVGTVTVASDVVTYRGECSLLAPNEVVAWADALEALVRDEAARRTALEAQRAFVAAHRSWRTGTNVHRELLAGVCADVRAGRLAPAGRRP